MSKLITRIKRLALALCLATPVVSWAAPTATAVWRSNLGQSYTIGGNTYALTIPSNDTKASGVLNQDGTVTLTNEWTGLAAPYFDLSATGTENVSVLVKFSGLSIPASGDYGTSLAGVLDSDGNEVGAYVQSGETSLCAFYMASNATSPTQIRINDSDDAVVADGYMLFSYSASSGVKAYVGGTIETLIGGEKTGYNYSDRTISRLLIGGDNGKYYNPNGFTIEDVAVFVGSYLSNDDVAEYVFPTVTVDPEITTMSDLNTKVASLDNEFLYFSSAASVTLDAEPETATQTFLQSDNWKGTVLIRDVEKLDINPTIYGNKNSTLKLSGVSGYFAKAQYPSNVTPQIELENSETEGKEYGFKQTNGYSFNSKGAYAYVNTPKLKGSGTLWGAWNGRAFYVVGDYSEFTGVLKLDTGDVVWLGVSLPETVSAVEAEVLQKYIRLGGTIPANVADWTADAYDGTVRLTTAISSEDSYKGTFLQNSKWKGTCQLAWNPGSGAFDIVNYGNANSVIEITTNFGPYPTQNGGNAAANFAGEIRIAEGVTWTVSNGWDNKTTTFAKLSGGGTLTVNGTTSSSTAIPYTITTLEGFTGTLAGGRGQFTIGTIVSSVEPTPGTKLVNCTTTNAPVLDNTVVRYNNADVTDIELEFKAGDGIYVAETVVNVASITVSDEVYYYASLTGEDGAIANSMSGSRVITLLANVNEAYELASDGRLKVALAGYTWTGLTAPTGYQINAAYSEATGVTTYTCVEIFVAKARIGTTEGQNEYASVDAALEAVLSLNMAVGTVVYVLDENYARSSTSATLQQYFTWNGSASPRTWTRKATTNGEGSQTVAAGSALDACNAVTVLPTNSDVENALQGYSYASYFQKTAKDNGDGTWTVTVALSAAQVFEGTASETAALTATLDGVLDDEAESVTFTAKNGLYYSILSGTEPGDVTTEGTRVLATEGSVTLEKPATGNFFKIAVHTAAE